MVIARPVCLEIILEGKSAQGLGEPRFTLFAIVVSVIETRRNANLNIIELKARA